jgi:hypothetical protein
VLATGFLRSTFARHLPTILGTDPTRLNAFVHIANFFAIVSTRLADFCAIHHEPKMCCFNVFSTCFKAVI